MHINCWFIILEKDLFFKYDFCHQLCVSYLSIHISTHFILDIVTCINGFAISVHRCFSA